ncbi:histidine kinase [Microvirga flavescens]|uniref:histidine kinase n=1 Tax=Microvirga flavescens TaxID=2249811 RepID=UPI000DDAF188|nr:histidine kinase [Microvirga flavescens]
MADYYPLIARAVEGLADRSPEMRRAVYERARTALLGQLRSLDPPLSEADIEAESVSLDDAIARIEASYAPPPPPAPEPDFAGLGDFESKALSSQSAFEPVPLDEELAPPPEEPIAVARPRVDSRSALASSSGNTRTIVLGAVIALVIVAIAVAAWVLRDTPESLPAQPPVAETPAQRPAQEAGKFNERVGGQSTPVQASQPKPDLGVAQRAVFYEEDPSNPQTPKAQVGKVVWRLENVSGGQGQPLETAVRAAIEIPDAGINLNMTIRRNTDATLPASHTVELLFTTRAGDTSRVIRDIGLLQFKNEEAARGTPLAGLPVPVRENIFLIGLSNLSGDIERNVEMFIHRNWIDLPVRMASGQRAILSFEKGASGEQVVNNAFRQWQ